MTKIVVVVVCPIWTYENEGMMISWYSDMFVENVGDVNRLTVFQLIDEDFC